MWKDTLMSEKMYEIVCTQNNVASSYIAFIEFEHSEPSIEGSGQRSDLAVSRTVTFDYNVRANSSRAM
jgi:hypothetical protein